MKTVVIAFVFALLCAQASAQYRCNVNGRVVYQDRSCVLYPPAGSSQPAKAQDVQATGGTANDPISIGKESCKNRAPDWVVWKDPSSVVIGGVYGGKTEIIYIGGSPVQARVFVVGVNAKNSYGGYVGEKSIICYTSFDGNRVLKINSALVN